MLVVNYNSFLLKLAGYAIQAVPRNMQVTLNVVNDRAQVVVKSYSWPAVITKFCMCLHVGVLNETDRLT